jgi:hypothetical protein
MGSGPSKMEALETDEGSEKAELGTQHPGPRCLPASIGTPKPGRRLDNIAGQRGPRARSGCDASGSANASRGARFRETSINSAGNGNARESGWARCHQYRAGQPGYLVHSRLQSGLCVGSANLRILPTAFLSRHWYWLRLGSGHRSRPVFRWLGRLGMVAQLVRWLHHTESFFLSPLRFQSFSRRSAGQLSVGT